MNIGTFLLNTPTFQKLAFDSIRDVVGALCASSLGKQRATSMRPATDVQVVRRWLGQVEALGAVVDDAGYPPMGGITDIRELVHASAFPTPLEAVALASIAETLAATAPLSRWLETVSERTDAFGALAGRISDLSPIAVVIQSSIDGRGAVRDSASPRLGTIRQTIEQAKEQIRAVFDRILRHSGQARLLQYAGSTFHNDRYVLPLKAEHRGRIQGIVHRSSDSGSTLFVEPAESVELNNTIVRLRDEESQEITRILRTLTQRVQLNAEVILETVNAIGLLDLIAAKCRYGRKRACVCPEIDESGIMALHEARHPVLVELFDPAEPADGEVDRPSGSGAHNEKSAPEAGESRNVVPIDVRLGEDFDVLMVTGPNTGGKTVTLKTVGLMALMTQCGIPIPAGPGSRLPVYKSVFVDIGDEQSIQQSLSTFSSHLTNLLDILRHCGPRSLVLIDELGAGTDPDEGAAIGQAVVSELLRLKAKAVVTTHLSTLKSIAFTESRVDNACVEFDVESLKPTYHLRIGEPGNSNALTIAQRLGMPHRMIRLARQSLSGRSQALNQAIAGTLDSRRAAEAARKAALEAEQQSRRKREEFERRRQELEQSRDAFAKWTVWINALKPGDRIFLKTLRRPAQVVRMQLHKQSALVSAGAMDIEVPIKELAEPSPDDTG